MSNPDLEPPLNPLPPVVMALFVVMMGVEAVFSLGAYGLVGGPEAVGWRQAAIEDYGFNADVMAWMVENSRWPVEHLMRLVTYPFVNGSFTGALFAGVMLLAMGKFVGEIFSQGAVLAVFVISSLVGALAYWAIGPGQPWLIGGFPPVYGLIGAFTYLLWLKLGQVGAQQYRAFTLIGFLMGIQLVFGLIFGANAYWVADVGGFVAGFLSSFVLSPGGFAKLREKLRHR